MNQSPFVNGILRPLEDRGGSHAALWARAPWRLLIDSDDGHYRIIDWRFPVGWPQNAGVNTTFNLLNDHQTRRSSLLQVPGLLALMVLLAWAGRGQGAEPSSPAGNPAGTYTLQSVDGKEVPCTTDHDGHKLTIQSGQFDIKAGGTCSSRMVFSVEGGNETTREVKATYTLDGSTLTMKWRGAGTTTGTVDGDTFTMTNEGMVLAYQKKPAP